MDEAVDAIRPSPVHERHCFVVMPHGRSPEEVRWYRGWYEVVIKPTVIQTGYEAILASTEEQPGAINDEIRAHLAFDPMVVVDLAGADPEEDPNPNVMYELGIRHALGLPLVMMAWHGQRLPFDVGNQRVIMEQRDLVDLETNRKKLAAFVHAAAEGRYYRPMQAVGRVATIEAASMTLGQDSILGALVAEVRELRSTVGAASAGRAQKHVGPRQVTVKTLIRSLPKNARKNVYAHFLAAGGTTPSWARVLRIPVTSEFAAAARRWTVNEWESFVVEQLTDIERQRDATTLQSGDIVRAESLTSSTAGTSALEEPPTAGTGDKTEATDLTKELVAAVAAALPEQPWPVGIHKTVAAQLGISNTRAHAAISSLIESGVFKSQDDKLW